MKSKTLSKVTGYVFLWAVASVALTANKEGLNLLTQYISIKQTNFFVGIPMFCLVILLWSRLFSYFMLSGHKGQKIDGLVRSYRWYYIMLTDEARQEWQDFIAAERERINKKPK